MSDNFGLSDIEPVPGEWVVRFQRDIGQRDCEGITECPILAGYRTSTHPPNPAERGMSDNKRQAFGSLKARMLAFCCCQPLTDGRRRLPIHLRHHPGLPIHLHRAPAGLRLGR